MPGDGRQDALRRVEGAGHDLLRRRRPHLTVHTGIGTGLGRNVVDPQTPAEATGRNGAKGKGHVSVHVFVLLKHVVTSRSNAETKRTRQIDGCPPLPPRRGITHFMPLLGDDSCPGERSAASYRGADRNFRRPRPSVTFNGTPYRPRLIPSICIMAPCTPVTSPNI